MSRKLLLFTSAAAFLMCIAVVVLWVRSYSVSDCFGLSPLLSFSTDRGEALILIAEPMANFSVERGYSREDLPGPRDPWNFRNSAQHTWRLLGVHGEQFPGMRIVAIQFWGVLLMPLLVTLILTWQALRVKSYHKKCNACGYNLTGNISGTCPECGTQIIKG